MKLLSQKQTDSIFTNNSLTYNGRLLMNNEHFNQAVNALLMDAKIMKSLLKQAKRIKEKNYEN